MIVVTAQLTVQAGKKAELLELARDLIAATRQETGCISYLLLEDPFDLNKCVFVEEWKDKQALEEHFKTSHISKWRNESKDLLVAAVELKLYEAEETKLF